MEEVNQIEDMDQRGDTRERMLEAMGVYQEKARERWDLDEEMDMIVLMMDKLEGPKGVIWRSLARDLDEFPWEIFYAHVCDRLDDIEADWMVVLRDHARYASSVDTERMKPEEEKLDSPLSSRRSSVQFVNQGPKQRHHRWKGGDLIEWSTWKHDFCDLAEEFQYDEDVGARRLKKYAAGSPEYTMIVELLEEGNTYKKTIDLISQYKTATLMTKGKRNLSEVRQGRDSIEQYYARWSKTLKEIKMVTARKFTQDERIDYFLQGLNDEMRKALPFWKVDRASFRNVLHAVLNMEAEMNRYVRRPTRTVRKVQRRNTQRRKDEKSMVACWEYRDTGDCKYGDQCRYTHLTTGTMNNKSSLDRNESRSSWKKRCYYGRDCRRDNCRFWHQDRDDSSRTTNVNMEEEGVANDEQDESEGHEHAEYDDTESDTESLGWTGVTMREPEDDSETESSGWVLTVSDEKAAGCGYWWDSGCSTSQTDRRDLFATYKNYETPKFTTVGGLRKLEIKGVGTVIFRSKSTNKKIIMKLEYVPELGFTLISGRQLAMKGVKYIGEDRKVEFWKDGELLMKAELHPRVGLYGLDIFCDVAEKHPKRADLEKAFVTRSVNAEDDFVRTHERLGHINSRDLLYMCKNELSKGLNTFEEITYARGRELIKKCTTCIRMKPTRRVKKDAHINQEKRKKIENISESKRSMDKRMKREVESNKDTNEQKNITIATDFCGPLSRSLFGRRYFAMSMIKEMGYIVAKTTRRKTNVLSVVKELVSEAESNRYIVIKHESDDGGEFRDQDLMKYARRHGIEVYLTAGYDSNANAKAERAIRSVLEIARSVMVHRRIPEYLRDPVIRFAAYVKNRCYSKWRKGVPYTMLKKRRPEFNHLYVVGSLAWARIPKEKYGKMEERQVRCMYVGPGDMLKPRRKGGVFININELKDGVEWKKVEFVSRRYKIFEDLTCELEKLNLQANTGTDIDEDAEEFPDTEQLKIKTREWRPIQPIKKTSILRHGSTPNTREEKKESDVKLRRSSRRKRRRITSGEEHGLWSLVQMTWKEAMSGESRSMWMDAVKKEMEAIVKMGTRTLVKKSNYDARIKMNQDKILTFKTRFVLDFKEHEKRYKARLVVMAWNWKNSTWGEFYSPVVDESTFLLLLNIAVYEKWNIESWDAKNAFLNGRIPSEYEIYVHPPENQDNGYMWRLWKALYGLPIASKLWYKTVARIIEGIGWKRSRFDDCAFIKLGSHDQLIGMCVIHVDDFQVTGTEEIINELKEGLFESFDMKNVGFGRYCGINLRREKNYGYISIDMEDYIEKIYEKYGKPIPRKMPYRTSFVKNIKPGDKKGKDLKSLTGALLYAAKVRPDIKFIVSFMCEYNDKYDDTILEEAKRIVGYLWNTKRETLRIDPKTMKLHAAFDSDFAACTRTRKSRSGWLFLIGGSYLASASKKQKIVTDSSTYAETKCLTDGCKRIVYYREFLNELGYRQEEPTIILQDNIQTIRIIERTGNQSKSRGFDISYHYTQDLQENGVIQLKYEKSRNMPADALNKAVGKNIFNDFKKRIGLEYHEEPEEGAKRQESDSLRYVDGGSYFINGNFF